MPASNAPREPIQVYLAPDERAELDRLASVRGVSRSEALRRGIAALSDELRGGAGRAAPSGWWSVLEDPEIVTPRRAAPGPPPPSRPVALFRELLEDPEHRP